MEALSFSVKVYSGTVIVETSLIWDQGPYYKSELELKLNSSEILPVNCKFICDSLPT